MALDIQLVLLEPADIELLSRSASLKLSGNVLFVIANDSVKVELVWKTGMNSLY